MNFIGIDAHANRFTCCYRDERRADRPEDRVKEAIIGNTCQLKQISLARNNTDRIDADKLCQAPKAQILSGVQQVVPVTLPPGEIQELRGLFSTCRLYQKQNTQLKNRIRSLLKEQLYGFIREEIFDRKSREEVREISPGPVLNFQINQLMDRLERDEGDVKSLKERVLAAAEPFMAQIDILTSMKGVSVFIAIAIIADIIDVNRFKNSRRFTLYLRSAPGVGNSNTTVKNRGTNKMGRKLSATLITQSLNQVMSCSGKLRGWYERLCEYKKAGLVRTGLSLTFIIDATNCQNDFRAFVDRDTVKYPAAAVFCPLPLARRLAPQV